MILEVIVKDFTCLYKGVLVCKQGLVSGAAKKKVVV